MGEFEILTYVQRQNPYLLFQEPLIEISDDDIDSFVKEKANGLQKDQLSHNFNRRMLKNLLSNCNNKVLIDRDSEWIIIDSYYAHIDYVLEVRKGDCKWYYSSDGFTDLVYDYLNWKKGYELNFYEACINYTLSINKLVEFLKKWDGHIIIINAIPARNSFSLKHYKSKLMDNPIYECSQSARFCNLIAKLLKCYIINLPNVVMSKDGFSVHYTDTLKDYLKNCVLGIVHGQYNQPMIELDYYCHMEEQQLVDESMIRTVEYKKNTIKKMKSTNPLIQARQFHALFNLCNIDNYYCLLLGDCYYFGYGTIVDREKAKKYYDIAYRSKIPKAYKRLIDYYLSDLNDHNRRELLILLNKYVKKEDPYSISIYKKYYQGHTD